MALWLNFCTMADSMRIAWLSGYMILSRLLLFQNCLFRTDVRPAEQDGRLVQPKGHRAYPDGPAQFGVRPPQRGSGGHEGPNPQDQEQGRGAAERR